MKQSIGLVVPGLTLGGGVPAVARFIRDTIVRDGKFGLKQISLATSAKDPCNASLAVPHTWRRGAIAVQDQWESAACLHVGAIAGELEFQRYRPRAPLSRALAGCNLIQVVSGSPAWANAVIGMDVPVALHVATRAHIERRQRDAKPLGFADWWRKGMTKITDRMDDIALRHVDAVQVMNPWMLEYARAVRGTVGAEVQYAPPGIDVKRFSPIAPEQRSKDLYILCVARLSDPRKNLTLLLEAYAQLPQTVRASIRLVLAGSCAPPRTFWIRADALGLRNRITYVEKPDSDALLKLYQHASVFVLPSDEEGFGMVVIEAMACGVPVISTRSGGPDGIITDGSDGYLVPLDDAATLADRMLRLLQDPANSRSLGDAARATVERRYDERIAGEVFLDIWDRMARKGRPA